MTHNNSLLTTAHIINMPETLASLQLSQYHHLVLMFDTIGTKLTVSNS